MTKSALQYEGPTQLLSRFLLLFVYRVFQFQPLNQEMSLASVSQHSQGNDMTTRVCLCGMSQLIQQLLLLPEHWHLYENTSDWFTGTCLSHPGLVRYSLHMCFCVPFSTPPSSKVFLHVIQYALFGLFASLIQL